MTLYLFQPTLRNLFQPTLRILEKKIKPLKPRAFYDLASSPMIGFSSRERNFSDRRFESKRGYGIASASVHPDKPSPRSGMQAAEYVAFHVSDGHVGHCVRMIVNFE
jgi:hypothetical protein